MQTKRIYDQDIGMEFGIEKHKVDQEKHLKEGICQIKKESERF